MKRLNKQSIWRDSNRLLLETEGAVRAFSRYHKYMPGSDMRRQAMGVIRLLVRVLDDKSLRYGQVKRLHLAVDDFNVQI